MSFKEKLGQLADNMNNLLGNPKVQEELAKEQEPKNDKPLTKDELFDALDEWSSIDDVSEVEETQSEAKQEDMEEKVPIANVDNIEATNEAAEETKQEEVVEAASEEKVDYSAQLAAQQKEIEELKKLVNSQQEAKEEVEDPIVHNPEAKAKRKWVGGGDPKKAPDDPMSAFMHHFGE